MMRKALGGLGLAVAALAAALTLGWLWLAVGVHLTGAGRIAAEVGIGFAALVALSFLWRGSLVRLGAVTLVGVIVAQVWFAFVPASNDRVWAPELAHNVTADITGSTVVLHNIRNFVWAGDSFTPAWESRVVDADQITSVDLVTATWGNPWVAHTMISFGFADGQHVAFSAEIRRTKDEEFSVFGGLVRQFELVLIGADERDVIQLRTDSRDELASLFPLTLQPAQRKALFLSFVQFGNALAAQPQWYNTLTDNCTTVPFRIARALGDPLPLDWRIILSGRVQGYLYDRGWLRPDLSLAEIETRARLPEFGPMSPGGAAYSRAIRAAWPD